MTDAGFVLRGLGAYVCALLRLDDELGPDLHGIGDAVPLRRMGVDVVVEFLELRGGGIGLDVGLDADFAGARADVVEVHEALEVADVLDVEGQLLDVNAHAGGVGGIAHREARAQGRDEHFRGADPRVRPENGGRLVAVDVVVDEVLRGVPAHRDALGGVGGPETPMPGGLGAEHQGTVGRIRLHALDGAYELVDIDAIAQTG